MRHRVEPSLCVAALVVTALGASGCLVSRTEVLTVADGRRVFGDYLVSHDTAADEKTIFRWNAGQAAYVDPLQKTSIRVARLKGAVHVAQLSGGKAATATSTAYILVLARIEPRVGLKLVSCSDGEIARARALVPGMTDGEEGVLAASRDQILALLSVLAEKDCESGAPADMELGPEELHPSLPTLTLGREHR